MDIKAIAVDKPEDMNFILGQAHFIKTVEDLHEAIVTTAPHMKFGMAFCESSGLALVRRTGNDEALVELAMKNALAVGAGHSFFIFLDAAASRSTSSTRSRPCPRSAGIYCATANPAEVVVAETDQGRGILGVVDGVRTKGVEGPDGDRVAQGLPAPIGYKL
ncbi:MAG: adenosine-specific kinase [Comamonadaceae bacterium]|nr:adenosine-specific kinase [Comamonadaceae bacterium]